MRRVEFYEFAALATILVTLIFLTAVIGVNWLVALGIAVLIGCLVGYAVSQVKK